MAALALTPKVNYWPGPDISVPDVSAIYADSPM